MMQGANNLPGESPRYLIVHKSEQGGVARETDSIDISWGGINEQEIKEIPVDGYVIFYVAKKHHLWGDYIEMRTIFVDKNSRKRGVGTKLFKKLEQVARQEKVKRIVIKVTCSKEDANPFCLFLPAMGYKNNYPDREVWDWEKNV